MSLIDRDFIMKNLGYGDTQQENIDFCIEWVTSRAETYIGRKLTEDDFTWYLNGTGGSQIVLPACPVTAITSLHLDSSRTFDTETTSDYYYLDEATGIIDLYSKTTPIGYRTIKVVATAGYTQDTLPGDLKMAFISAISHHMLKLLNKGFGVSAQSSPDGGSMSYEMELPSDTKRVFDSYKEMRV